MGVGRVHRRVGRLVEMETVVLVLVLLREPVQPDVLDRGHASQSVPGSNLKMHIFRDLYTCGGPGGKGETAVAAAIVLEPAVQAAYFLISLNRSVPIE